MVNKMEIAQAFDASPGQMVDSIRHFHVFGTVEDANTLMVTGDCQILFRAPFACKLVGCILRAETIETTDSADEVLTIRKSASGTTLVSGTVMVQYDPVSDLTAATDEDCTILTAAGANLLVAGDSVSLNLAGTINELTGVSVSLKLERLN